MNLEKGLRIARDIITRHETEREAIKRTLAEEKSKQAFQHTLESGLIEPDDYPNAHFKIKRRMNLPFRRRQKPSNDFNISTIIDIEEDPRNKS